MTKHISYHDGNVFTSWKGKKYKQDKQKQNKTNQIQKTRGYSSWCSDARRPVERIEIKTKWIQIKQDNIQQKEKETVSDDVAEKKLPLKQ